MDSASLHIHCVSSPEGRWTNHTLSLGDLPDEDAPNVLGLFLSIEFDAIEFSGYIPLDEGNRRELAAALLAGL